MLHENGQDIVTQAIVSRTLAQSEVQRTPKDEYELLGEYSDGKVKVYGRIKDLEDKKYAQLVSPRRTEIELDNVTIAIHKGSEEDSSSTDFCKIEVKKGNETRSLSLRANNTNTKLNPIYSFAEDNKIIGHNGYGQNMDFLLASRFTRKDLGGIDSHVPDEVIGWIRNTIT